MRSWQNEKKKTAKPERLPESKSVKKPNRTGVAINIWVDPGTASALERFRLAQRVKPSKTDVVELALIEFLKREGFSPADEADGD